MTTSQTPHYRLRAPNDDELVTKGAEAIRNLATDVDTALHNVVQGIPAVATKTVAGSTVGATNAWGWLTINFPAGSFTQPPIVVVTNGDSVAWQGFMLLLGQESYVTATGYTVVAMAGTAVATQFTKAYAEWTINRGDVQGSTSQAGNASMPYHAHSADGNLTTRLMPGATGAPTFAQAPTGAIRVNWVAVGK